MGIVIKYSAEKTLIQRHSLQSDAEIDVTYMWTVRWDHLVDPSQRFTIALWNTVRDLERQLNGPQLEPGVYVINNTALLSGVKYIFNVTASSNGMGEVTKQSFNIDNFKGDPKLLIEGRSDMFSVVLVGGQIAHADTEFTLEALVTTCYKTHDYYFEWSVWSGDNIVNVSDVKGSRVEIRANSLTPGLTYNVLCKVLKQSNGDFITESGLPFHVLHRDPNVYFSIDELVVSIGTAFSIQTNLIKIDYSQNEVTVKWKCSLNDEVFEEFHGDSDGSLVFPSGLPSVGEYLISVTVDVLNKPKTSVSTTRIIAVEIPLPVIEVHSLPRLVNEGSIIELEADIRDVTPGCTITWLFKYDKCVFAANTINSVHCTENEYGILISDPMNIYSLEENFLSELTDFSNETSLKVAQAQMEAAEGTARVVVECKCNLVHNCSMEGTAYATIKLGLNEKPDTEVVMVTPETGIAMETLFRLSTLALIETHRPLQYKFYCNLGNNESLVLGSYLEYTAMETLLPYVDGGTSIWLQTCDSLGACSKGKSTLMQLSAGEARTLEALIEDVQALALRCELGWLLRLTVSTIVTYTNTGQTEAHTKFTTALLEMLRGIEEHCVQVQHTQYNELVYWLAKIGVDMSEFV